MQLICDAGFIFLEPKRRKGRIVSRQIWSKKGVILGGQKRVFLGGGVQKSENGGSKISLPQHGDGDFAPRKRA